MTIPNQDLTGFDLLLHHARSWNSNALDSRHAPSSSRHQQLDPVVRSGRAARGGAPAAAQSAFASAESSPIRTAEDLSSTAEAPAKPDDHPATEPALSRLLAPPFNNAELRGDFIASLERHLAEYEDHGKAEVEADKPDDSSTSFVKDGHGEEIHGRGNRHGDGHGGDQKARQDSGGSDYGAATNDVDGKDNGYNGVDDSFLLQTMHAVKEMPVGATAGEPGSRRDVETALMRVVGPGSTSIGDAETPNVEVEAAPVGGFGGEMRGREEDGKEKAALQETPDDSSKGAGGGSSTWAQEYHDYLCSKDP